MLTKIFLSFSALLFILFAYFQLNDPDGLMWTLYYALLATLAILSLMGKNKNLYIGLLSAFTILYMAYLLPGFINWFKEGMPSITSSMKAESPYIEVVREFLGLVIGLIYLIILYFSGKR